MLSACQRRVSELPKAETGYSRTQVGPRPIHRVTSLRSGLRLDVLHFLSVDPAKTPRVRAWPPALLTCALALTAACDPEYEGSLSLRRNEPARHGDRDGPRSHP